MTCDRCGARSFWLATLVSGHTLEFCNHHAAEQGPALKLQGAVIAALVPPENVPA